MRTEQRLLRQLPVSLYSTSSNILTIVLTPNSTQYKCGAQDPTPQNTSTLTSTASKTSGSAGSSSTGGDFTTFGGSGSSKSEASLLVIGQSYGLGIVGAGLIAGFAFIL